ncbi:MAG: hypothetical protein ACOCX2_02520, partial [Armatimonadota bacterium]
MQGACTLLLAAALLTLTATTNAATVRFDTQILEVEPPIVDDFADLDAWEVGAGATVEGGRLILDGDDAMAALEERIEGAQLLTFTAQIAAGGEVEVSFCVSPEGAEAGSYALAFTPDQLRLMEEPGGHLVDRNPTLGTADRSEFDVAIMKFDERIRVFVDDRLALDYWDHGEPGIAEPPLEGGRIAFSSTGRMEVSDFAVHRITARSVAMIDELKDLHLQTDLREATIVIGDSDAHRQAADRIAATVEQRTGEEVAVSSDVDRPDEGAVIALGNFADNPLIERLYNQWYTIVDRRFPG